MSVIVSSLGIGVIKLIAGSEKILSYLSEMPDINKQRKEKEMLGGI